MPASSSKSSHSRSPSVQLLEGLAAQDAANMAAKAKREKQLMLQRARSRRHYQRKKLEAIMV